MSQPPLSNQLKLLEDELGVELFERKNKRLLLTPDGQLLYKYAKNLVADFDHTMQIFEDIRDGINGTLNIGCICSPAIMFLPTFMKSFMEKNPHLNLQVYEGNSNALLGLSTDSFTAVASLLVNGDKLVTKKLIKPTIKTKTLLVWKKNQLLSPTAKKFIDEIQLRRRIMTSFQQE